MARQTCPSYNNDLTPAKILIYRRASLNTSELVFLTAFDHTPFLPKAPYQKT